MRIVNTWVTGFVEEFETAVSTKKSIEQWRSHLETFDSIINFKINNNSGELVHDVSKESPLVAPQATTRSSKRTSKKKAVRKTARTSAKRKG